MTDLTPEEMERARSTIRHWIGSAYDDPRSVNDELLNVLEYAQHLEQRAEAAERRAEAAEAEARRLHTQLERHLRYHEGAAKTAKRRNADPTQIRHHELWAEDARTALAGGDDGKKT